MATAKCFKCGGSAIADTFEQARNMINHAVGLSRGIKCGDNYGRVQEIDKKPQKTSSPPETKVVEPKTTEPKPETTESPVTSEKPVKAEPKPETTEAPKKTENSKREKRKIPLI